MDGLSKLGFLSSEMLLKDEEHRFVPRENVAIICFNSASCLDTDMQYEATICDNENYFPSPALFVYTLPNIVAGEIAIRNKFHGETFFYLCRHFCAAQMVEVVNNVFQDKTIKTVLVAWLEYFENQKEAMMMQVENGDGNMDFTEEQLNILYAN
jgi:3-oxoacyl-[acyl-carrier-protein] synthase-1